MSQFNVGECYVVLDLLSTTEYRLDFEKILLSKHNFRDCVVKLNRITAKGTFLFAGFIQYSI